MVGEGVGGVRVSLRGVGNNVGWGFGSVESVCGYVGVVGFGEN